MAPMWFVWDGECVWLNSIVRSQRWHDVISNSHIAVVVDAGDAYTELRGIELRGFAEVVGDVPRTDVPHPELDETERLMGLKYSTSQEFVPDGRHAWLRIRPTKIVSWDFRKNTTLNRA